MGTTIDASLIADGVGLPEVWNSTRGTWVESWEPVMSGEKLHLSLPSAPCKSRIE